ncbi:hypothetical protein KFL_000790230 [Klebsormidium nitens]|uniref:L-2-hydroxyglutarate dehydrogenase, mitochondrial n=1 Tax=Klebsormidium nitens TaxID=105231 RepID=A0A1Y1HZW3_KLENI|nr:hypothetical protein KFL_000790230 [Klebsormidium nitens]|eukprot:GAQ81398.1 hypothetical protein KFL_000790230 [Klebsormidium nitens]
MQCRSLGAAARSSWARVTPSISGPSWARVTPRIASQRFLRKSYSTSAIEEEKADVVVIGAGVVGLAIARLLALSGREVLVLEADAAFGTGTSSRNSEIIHAGLYYQVGSLKAQLCVEGNRMLYDYAREHDVGHRRLGKLITACGDDEIPKLAKLHENAKANGVSDVDWISSSEATDLEPNVRCVAALLSTNTGIIDSHGLMAAFLAEAEDHGAVLAVNSTVTGGEISQNGISLEVTDSTDLRSAEGAPVPPTMRLSCSAVVNAAGLDAQATAKKLAHCPPELIPRRYLARGNYFSFSGAKSPFSRLVYPIPPEGGLGVHVTVDLGGQCKFGPDVEWLPEGAEQAIASYDYTVDPSRAAAFYSAIRAYYPDLPEGSLEPAYAGIRPKLFGSGQADVGSTDFMIQGPADHGVPGLVNLFGIESPGLTSCLAIAEDVARKLTATKNKVGSV